MDGDYIIITEGELDRVMLDQMWVAAHEGRDILIIDDLYPMRALSAEFIRKESEYREPSSLSHGGWHDLPKKPRSRWKNRKR